ncbi:tetratricopeptide repeat protein [Aureimonas sp. AU12]|uniref:tetratricopeptide repeat protein n=1 Tax=Aureimonas sp. AU12 TaxID=1638161 RepID=UPI0009EA2781|nr:tetratricopeptide repeat protein [Aureimonas sp. AU12]
MSNDIFVREVNEEMRQERVRALWVRYGMIAIAAAVLVVVAAGGYVLFERYRAGVAAADGDRLIAAGSLIAEGKTDEAKAALEALVSDGSGSYPKLARLRLADMMQAQDPAGAVARYDEVANDTGTPADLRDMAAIRAAYILVDTGSLADVRARVERLTGDGASLRYPAREAVALAAWKAGDVATARPLFTQLQDDLGTPQGIKRRAGLMLELIAASTVPVAPEASPLPPATVDPEAETEAQVPPAAPTPAPVPVAPAATTPDAAPLSTPATPEAGVPAAPAAPSTQAPAAPQPPA